MTGPAPLVTRKNVRHLIVRRRNERIAAGGPDFDDWPVAIHMHPETRDDLLMDRDGHEQHTMDFEGSTFLRIPVVVDDTLAPGEFALRWAREVPDGPQ
jgi:hypothetical protein